MRFRKRVAQGRADEIRHLIPSLKWRKQYIANQRRRHSPEKKALAWLQVQAVSAVPLGFSKGDACGGKVWLVHQDEISGRIAPEKREPETRQQNKPRPAP
jgi:hypothetical protein